MSAIRFNWAHVQSLRLSAACATLWFSGAFWGAASFVPSQSASPVRADAETRLEHQVKAAALFHISRYVVWPANAFVAPETPITVGVMGCEDFHRQLCATLQDKKAHGRSFETRKLSVDASLPACHLLVVGATGSDTFAGVKDTIGGAPVLTVGAFEGFADHSGMIALEKTDGKIRIAVNARRAREANLRISSKLLRLARIVER